MAAKEIHHTVGRRKSAIARIYLTEGKGHITVNGKSINDYYLRPASQQVVRLPLELTDSLEKYDIRVNVQGGGLHGQAGAVSHALSRALVLVDSENRTTLKQAKLLRRDPRTKERKLPGQPGARKKFQFSKR